MEANKADLIDYIGCHTDTQQGLHKYVNPMLLTQYGIKRGLQLFEQERVNVILKGLKQMHDLDTVEPLDASCVTKDMGQKSLNHLKLLKYKLTETVKGRGCANRRKPKVFVKKEDAATPTGTLPALILSCLQYIMIEHRTVTTADIP